MDFLARREYGQLELIKKLAGKGYDRSVSEGAVSELTDEGLQSDGRFSEAFVRSRVNQGKGPVRIRLELAQKGLAHGVVEEAIVRAGADWAQIARAVRGRKFGDGHPPDYRQKARQMRFLQYRGFEQDDIQAAFNRD